MKRITLFSIFGALALAACGPAEPEATFTRVQEEILELNCATGSCHTGASPAAGLNLAADDTRDQLVDQDAQVNTGWKYVVAGDPEASLLYNIISAPLDDGQRQMPPGLELEDEKLQLVHDWIEAGALAD
jgi:hypothetical protein